MSPPKKIKVTLFGAGGKMGTEVISVLQNSQDFELAYLIENSESPSIGKEIAGIVVTSDLSSHLLKDTIFCDFTMAESAVRNASFAAEVGSPILIGTTGFSAGQIAYLESIGEKIPVMAASNLSRGVNVLYELLGIAAKKLGLDYQVEIVELHHKWKKDAPSGTAKEMVKILENSGYQNVPAHSLRMGDIVGEHQAIFSTEGETIILTHRAQSRKALARGVIPALLFLADAKPGLYTFKDALEAQWRL